MVSQLADEIIDVCPISQADVKSIPEIDTSETVFASVPYEANESTDSL